MRSRIWLSLPFVFLASAASPASSSPPFALQPDPVPGEAVIQTLAGVGGGLLFGVPSSFIGSDLVGGTGGRYDDTRFQVGGYLGLFAGIVAGSAVGVEFSGRLLGSDGEFGRAVLGSCGGFGAFFLLQGFAQLDPDEIPFWVALFALPSTGAVMGARSSIRQEGSSAQGSARSPIRGGVFLSPWGDVGLAFSWRP